MIFPLKSSMIFPVQFPVGKWHFDPSPPSSSTARRKHGGCRGFTHIWNQKNTSYLSRRVGFCSCGITGNPEDFITCMHLIKRLKRLLKPSKPLGFSWLQFVFSALVHTFAQPRKWVFKITSVAGRGLHWEFHDRQPGPFAEGPCGRALCGRPLLSGEGEPPAGEGDPIWGAVRLMIYHDVPTKHDEFP